MKFTLETPKNKQEEEWSPLPHELAVKEIDMTKGVFIGLNKPWARRGIKLVVALCLFSSFNSKLENVPDSFPQGITAQAAIGGYENPNTHTLIPDDIEKSIDEALESDKAPENLPVEENENISPESVSESFEKDNGMTFSEPVPVDATPSNENVSQTIVTPEPSSPVDLVVEAEPVVDKEAVSELNQDLRAFAENLSLGKQMDLVDDIRANYEALVQYTKGERNDVVKNGKEDFKNLVNMIEKKINNLNSPTQKLAKQNVLEMMQIINDYSKLRIPGKLAEWAKK